MRKILIISMLFIVSTFSYAQVTTTITQQATLGGSDLESPYSLIMNTDGSILLVGFSGSGISGDKTVASFGGLDIWVILLGSDFSVSWQNVYGGNGDESSPVAIKTSDGGYLIGCYSSSGISGNKTVDEYGAGDYWIIKIDNNGAIEWQNVYGGTEVEALSGLAETPEGDFLLCGSSQSAISGNKTAASIGLMDYWLVKIDSAGNLLWDKTYGGTDVNKATDMLLDKDNNLLLCGHSNSGISGTKTEDSYGSTDFWVVKTDLDGNVIWDKTLGGSTGEQNPICASSTTAFYIAGSSSSPIGGTKTEPPIGVIEFWVTKLDYDGNIIWDRTLGGNQIDGAIDLIVAADHQVVICGQSNSGISGDKTETNYAGGYDSWIVSVDSNGTKLWDKTLGGNGSDAFYLVTERSDNNYIFLGYSDSNISEDKAENSRGVEDYWVVEVGSNVGINQWSKNITGFIYPNPAYSEVRFKQNVTDVVVIDAIGQIVFEYSGELNTIDLDEWNSGLYFVTFKINDEQRVEKLIVE
ncbi:MAG: T9SS type A sorting domain-containing protein [Crocinitomicaceae bacterium]